MLPTRIALAFAAILACSGCTTAHVDERAAYWQAETERFLPKGATQQEAADFFRARGIELICCVSAPPEIDKAHYALERNAGSALWTRYDIAILVDFSSEGRVERIRVRRWGIGL